MNDYTSKQHVEDHRRPEEIESDLERTRAQMSSTIEAIQHKLTPNQMMDQAIAYARTSLPADFGKQLNQAVRDNPIPATLVGIGLAWLMMSDRQSNGRTRLRHSSMDSYAGADSEGTMHRGASSMSNTGRDIKDRVSETGHGIMDKARELGHRLSDSASSMTERARDMTHGARDRVQETTGDVRTRISDLGHRSQERYHRARSGFSQMVDEQPLVLGVLGIAVGAMLGAAFPSTRREDELMGRTRDDLLDKAKETARTQVDSVKESAQRVAEVATAEVKHVAEVASAEAKRVAENATSGLNDSMKPGGPAGQQYH